MIDAAKLPEILAARLERPLPGAAAQRQFAPEICYGRHFAPPRHDARQAAVIALLCPTESGWSIPLTLRPPQMTDHAGQISLPGGAIDAGETAETCAVRELDEELSVPADSVRLLGRLSPIYVFASNFLVTPVVGAALHMPELRPNPHEVAEVLLAPLDELLDRSNYGAHEIRRHGLTFRAPYILCGSHQVWGATCLILGELVAVLREATAD